MTRTSREPTLALIDMRNILIELFDVLMRVFWLAVAVAAVIGVLRMCAWADTGARDLPDNTVLPSERAKHINYGKP